jgi:hypothetical protein
MGGQLMWKRAGRALLTVALAVGGLGTYCAAQNANQGAGQEQKQSGAPPVWSAAYNAEQGALPDTSGWKVIAERKDFVVRLAPGGDWSRYGRVEAGAVRYTGSEIKLTPRQIAQVTDYLQKRLVKELGGVKLAAAAGASGSLRVDANITDARVSNRMVNVATVLASTMPGERDPANLTAWVLDGQTQKPVACIELAGGEASYEWFVGFRQIGQIRMALRAQSRTLGWVLTQIGPAIAAEKSKAASK